MLYTKWHRMLNDVLMSSENVLVDPSITCTSLTEAT